jgi:hypothetical protein
VRKRRATTVGECCSYGQQSKEDGREPSDYYGAGGAKLEAHWLVLLSEKPPLGRIWSREWYWRALGLVNYY